MPSKSSFPVPFTYPTEEEARAAQRACCGRVCSLCESPAQYAWRRREVDLSYLLRSAMERELSGAESTVLEQYWFGEQSLSEIAQQSGTAPSAVHKTLHRAMRKLENALWYVVQYQHDLEQVSTLLPLAVQRAMRICAAREYVAQTFPERLQKLRRVRNLSLAAAAQALRIGNDRLSDWESGETEPTLRELLALAAFYNSTVDELLKGDISNETDDRCNTMRHATYGANALTL